MSRKFQGFYSIEDVFTYARSGNLKLLNEALNYSVDNTTYWYNSQGYYSIHAAAAKGKTECIQLLLSKGLDVNISTPRGTALNVAVEKGHYNSALLLIENGATVDSKTVNGQTGLMLAASNGRTRCVDLMIKSGATVDAKDNCGYTSLFKAILSGHVVVVKLLLAAGADFELIFQRRSWYHNDYVMNSETSLEIACRYSRIECVTLLLNYGVSIKDDMNCYRPDQYRRNNHDCRPMLLEEKEHRLRRVVFDSFITHYIEYTPIINKIYSTCFPSGNIKTVQPPVGWIRADAVRNKYYLDEVFFYLHLHVADVHTKKLSSMSMPSSSSSRGFTELACNSDDTSTIMAVLTDRLKLYLQV